MGPSFLWDGDAMMPIVVVYSGSIKMMILELVDFRKNMYNV